MDELFDLSLEEGEIAATYVCVCDLEKKSHFPVNWYVNCSQVFIRVLLLTLLWQGNPKIAHTQHSHTPLVSFDQKVNCEGPRAHRLLNGGLIILHRIQANQGISQHVTHHTQFHICRTRSRRGSLRGEMETTSFYLQLTENFEVHGRDSPNLPDDRSNLTS